MKICVLGATGPSGQQVVKEALERGHDVTALVRNPAKLTDTHDKLKVTKVDIYNEDSMVEHMKGADAVISCLGCPPSWLSLWSITFYTDTAKPITAALRKAGVSRFIYMTSWYTKYDPGDGRIVNWLLKPIFLGQSTKSMGEMELYMRDHCSDLDHTSIRPPQLTDEPSEGKPVVAVEDYRVNGYVRKVCRQDVAKFILDIVNSGEWKKTCVAITSSVELSPR